MENQREESHPSTQSVKSFQLPVTIRDLLEAGVHFGHKKRRWNPKMRPYIFTERQNIHIIDLRKTMEQLEKAYRYVAEVASKGGKILFVCTKKQGKDVVEEQAKRAGVFYVVERWLGGTLTNFETIRQRVEHLKELEEQQATEQWLNRPKKERAKLERKYEKMKRVFDGIKDMETLPDLMYIVDITQEEIALKEAQKLEIPVVALVDTNADPEQVDVPIPGNDDAIRSIKIITRVIADAVIEGKQGKDFLVRQADFEKEVA